MTRTTRDDVMPTPALRHAQDTALADAQRQPSAGPSAAPPSASRPSHPAPGAAAPPSPDLARLKDPFPAEDIEWKPGARTRDRKKGLAMAYITARAVQDRLDEVFGVDGWRNEYRPGPDGGVICRIYFRDGAGGWCWREDGAENSDVEPVKGGLSNAMKRAASALGIGRYLYDMPSQWVPLNDKGRFAEIPRIHPQFLPPPGQQLRRTR